MDGYADGVKYYNEQKGTDVKVLGWDKAAQDGSFTGDFEKQDVGKQLTQNFLDQGGNFDNTPYVGTLENDGVQLAPFHDLDSQVPAELKTELEQIKKDIVDGKLTVESAASPKA